MNKSKKMSEKELNNRRAGALCGFNPYDDAFKIKSKCRIRNIVCGNCGKTYAEADNHKCEKIKFIKESDLIDVAKECNKSKQIQDELDYLIRLGVLRKDKKGYIDTSYSKEIDTMTSREAFIEGVEKSRKELLEEVEKIIINWQKKGCPDKIEMCHECIDELKKQLKKLGERR